MRAWLTYGFGDMRLQEVPEPEPQPGGVLVRVVAVQPGITEVLLLRGEVTAHYEDVRRMLEESSPRQLFGHEFCGEVVALGEGAGRFQVGDRVTAQHAEGYTIGYELPGCLAEYAALPAEPLARVPDRVSDGEAAACQPLASAVEAVEEAGVGPGDRVAILGQGVMGLFLLQACRAAGASEVYGVDPRPECLALSRKFGAALAIPSDRTDPVQEVLRATGGRGADVVFEAAGGSPREGLAGDEALQQALRMVARRGRLVGIAHYHEPVRLDLNALRKKQVRYIFPGASSVGCLEKALDLMAREEVQIKPLLTHQLRGIERVPEAFRITAEKRRYGALNPAQVLMG
ncbi:MAG: zinc-binding dehydrogenase [Nitrospinota bacterium]